MVNLVLAAVGLGELAAWAGGVDAIEAIRGTKVFQKIVGLVDGVPRLKAVRTLRAGVAGAGIGLSNAAPVLSRGAAGVTDFADVASLGAARDLGGGGLFSAADARPASLAGDLMDAESIASRRPTTAIGPSSPVLDLKSRGMEIFQEISDELVLGAPSAARTGTKAAQARSAVADAEAAGFTQGLGPGTVDLALQQHRDASVFRDALGVSGADVQSAHIGPTSFLRDVAGYSRGDADTVLLPRGQHAAFDQVWKDWAIAQRRNGETQVTVGQLHPTLCSMPSIAFRTCRKAHAECPRVEKYNWKCFRSTTSCPDS